MRHFSKRAFDYFHLCNESLEICVEWFAGALVGTFDCLDHKPHLLLTNFIQSLPVERLGMWECVGLQNLTPLGLDAGVVAECKGWKEDHFSI